MPRCTITTTQGACQGCVMRLVHAGPRHMTAAASCGCNTRLTKACDLSCGRSEGLSRIAVLWPAVTAEVPASRGQVAAAASRQAAAPNDRPDDGPRSSAATFARYSVARSGVLEWYKPAATNQSP